MAKAKEKEQVEPATEAAKIERIKKIAAKLEKDFGKGIIMGATDKPKYHDFLTTGSIGLDKALGIGGLPKGRIVEIYGPESSGKTTVAMHVMAEALKKNKDAYCAFVDAEHAFSTLYAEGMGLDLSRLQISQPDYGEQALDVTRELVESGDFDVVVVDSVAALVPKKELEGDIGDAAMGSQARMMSQALRMLVASVSKTNTVLIFINQLRDKIGVMFGSPETTTGGNALKFYASVRLDVRRQLSKDLKDGNEERIGNQTTVKVVKNKVAPPFRKCEFDIIYGEGIDITGEVLDLAVELDIVKKSGSWYSYNDNNIGQGREQTRQMLKDNPDLFAEIKQKTAESFTPKEYLPTEKEVQDAT